MKRGPGRGRPAAPPAQVAAPFVVVSPRTGKPLLTVTENEQGGAELNLYDGQGAGLLLQLVADRQGGRVALFDAASQEFRLLVVLPDGAAFDCAADAATRTARERPWPGTRPEPAAVGAAR